MSDHLIELLGVLLVEAFIGANKRIPANSTLGLVWHVLAKLGAAIVEAYKGRPPGGPTAVVVCLILLAAPVRADPSLPPTAPPSVINTPVTIVTPATEAAANAIPPTCPEPCAACAAKVGNAVAPAAWDKWGKWVTLGISMAGGAFALYAQGHQAGAW